jgi:hypothetical protein
LDDSQSTDHTRGLVLLAAVAGGWVIENRWLEQARELVRKPIDLMTTIHRALARVGDSQVLLLSSLTFCSVQITYLNSVVMPDESESESEGDGEDDDEDEGDSAESSGADDDDEAEWIVEMLPCFWIVRLVDRHEFGTLVQLTCTGETLDHINGSAIVRHVLRMEISASLGIPYLLDVDDKDVGSLEGDTGWCEYPQVHVSIVPLESRRSAVET